MELSFDKLQTKHKVFVFCTFYIAVVFLFMAAIWSPQQLQIAALRTDLAAARQAVGVIENYGLAHPDGAQHLAELDKIMLPINQLLPNDPDIGGFLVQVEQISHSSGVQLEQVVPNQAVPKNGYREIPVAMTIKGNYFQILDFLQRLEGTQRFSSAAAMALQAKSGLIEGKITVQVYAYGLAPVAIPSVQK